MRPLRVLIVEDEGMIALLYSEVLASLGHETSAIASTEDEAVESARTSKPDLMILDMHLKEGSGIGAVRRILAGSFIPHIFVSGVALRDGASDPRAIHLLKPFNEAQLVRAIDQAVALSAQASPPP